MPRIGLIYGTDTGNTEEVAFKLQERIEWAAVDVFDVANCSPDHMQNYDLLILGIPTWDFGGLQADWEEFWPLLEDMSFAGKTVALFGLGDQFGYGHYFLDALGMLHDAVRDRGANIIGHYSTVGFDFEASKALTEDGQHFVGLGLDEDQQMELTDQRISEWINQLQQELKLADCA